MTNYHSIAYASISIAPYLLIFKFDLAVSSTSTSTAAGIRHQTSEGQFSRMFHRSVLTSIEKRKVTLLFNSLLVHYSLTLVYNIQIMFTVLKKESRVSGKIRFEHKKKRSDTLVLNALHLCAGISSKLPSDLVHPSIIILFCIFFLITF